MAAKKKEGITNKSLSSEKGSITVAEAGRRGGKKTSETHGHEFYQEIGHKGGSKVKELIEAGKRAMEEEKQKQ